MGSAAGPVDIVFDPHVQNAILCLTLAIVAAVMAWVLDLPDRRR